MAPVKFGLFKARSREQEQPSTENLLQNSTSSEPATPGSPIPSTSKGQSADDFYSPDISVLQLDSDDEDIGSEKPTPTRRVSHSSVTEDPLLNYQQLTNNSSDTLIDDDATSCDANSIQFDESSIAPSEDLSVYCLKKKKNTLRSKEVQQLRDLDMWRASDVEVMQRRQLSYQQLTNNSSDTLIDDDATSCDANSIQFDESSIAPSEDLSVYCLKKKKNTLRSKEVQQLRDLDMWRDSDVEVMQNLLSRSGNLNDQFKWEAIATARGLCTLTDNCTCTDCARAKYLAGMADGDGGMSAAPLLSVGCVLQ
ncbi:uncharacterized protein LOC125238973 [Leguminivora glycinivorella]|uniref:uncharacterized protein LOC125238973 n=1 Tax=Leguminivora glycinivorella TaxID=1035111 RepID=UPI00200BCF70|nr:uncharacterized protein LOC125238973 [Leguminivora glycinivorella]